MIIPDANVLLHAINADAPHHSSSRTWLETALNGAETIGFDWVVLLAFLRISTHASILPKPLSVTEAWDVVTGWTSRSIAEVLSIPPAHAERLRTFTVEVGLGGNQTTDAHLAAMALGRGARICSFDSDFDRFAGITRISPL